MYATEIMKAETETPPRAGEIAPLAATTAPAVLSAATIGPQLKSNNNVNPGVEEHWLNLQAQSGGSSIFVNVGTTNASVTGVNVPDPTVVGVNAAKGCAEIPAGTTMKFYCGKSKDIFVGYVTATGTGTLRAWISSP